MTLITYHRDPQFMLTKNTVIVSKEGEILFDEQECITLRKTEDGRVFLGDPPGDVFEIVHKTALRDLLSTCLPARIEEDEDEEGDPFLRSIPLAETVSIDDIVSRIPLTINIPESTIKVDKIIN